MTYATLDELRSHLGRPATPAEDPAYVTKQLHKVPATTVVDRVAFVLERVTRKRVLEFGASGPLHEAIVKVAASCDGVDRVAAPHVVGFDLDDVAERQLPLPADALDVIVCGEVLEHLSNPGHFLTRMKRQYPGVPVIVTVPNAFSATAAGWIRQGVENVNKDHVAWYSSMTLQTLLTRCGFRLTEFYWYNGQPLTAEGIIVVCE